MESSQIYYVNSRNRDSGTDSDFYIRLDIDQNNKFDRISLLSVSIPKSFYNISEYNNKLLVLNEDGAGGSRLISIPIANYNRRSLSAVLTSLLNDNPQDFVYGISYTTNINVGDTCKFTITVTGNGGIQPVFSFQTSNTAFEILGFQRDSTNSFVADSLVSTNIINFNQENTFYLYTNVCQDKSSILQSIYTADTENNSFIIWNNDNPLVNTKVYIGSTSNLFHFFIRNEDDLPVNLNGLNINLSIILYQTSKTDEYIQKYIRYLLLKDDDNV